MYRESAMDLHLRSLHVLVTNKKSIGCVCSDHLAAVLNQRISDVTTASSQLSADHRNRVVQSLESVSRCC